MGSDTVIKDVVVLLPGIMGSTLAKDGEPVWAPSAEGVLKAITTFGRSIRGMTLHDDIGDDHPNDGVKPLELMPDLHFLPGIWTAHIGYGELLNWLRTRFHFIEPNTNGQGVPNLLPFAYDWRLSNRFNGRRLKAIVEPALDQWRAQGEEFADAKLIFICHSMGGLVARWFIEMEGGSDITRKLITLGTPYRGALNSLDQLVNGVKKGIGPLKFDLTTFARSLPSVHQLLPEYACIKSSGGLLKTTETDIPNLQASMIADAMQFHVEMDEAAKAQLNVAFDIHPIIGTRQATYATARITGNSVEPIETIYDVNEGGDGTVPSFASIPKSIIPNDPSIHYIADQHGSLQSNHAVFDQLEGILTSKPTIYRGKLIEIGVKIEPLVLSGEGIIVEAKVEGVKRVTLQAKVINELGKTMNSVPLSTSNGVHRVMLDPLPPGAYRVIVGGAGSMATVVSPVLSTVLVWG